METRKNELHVVVGASGATGRIVVRELVARGKRVRAVSRGGRTVRTEGVEVLAADATDRASMREVCRGAAVVYHCAMPTFGEWVELFPPITEAVIEAAAAAGAKLIFADDTWMYGKPGVPMTEDLPYRPVSSKGVLRAWLAEMILHAHDSGRVRAAIGRAGELYGPAVVSVLGRDLVGAALKGKRARFVGDPDQPLTPTFVEDFARALVVLGERDEALGGSWHVPAGEPVTGREFVRVVFDEAGSSPRFTAIGSGVAKTLGLFWPLAREGAEVVYQFEMPFVVDSSKYERAFGGSATPYREGIRHTLDWYRAADPIPKSPRIPIASHDTRPGQEAGKRPSTMSG